MASPKLLFISCSIVIYLFSLAIAQDAPLLNICLNDKGNFTANSSYQANLNHLLSSLTSNTEIDSGFYNASYGQNTDKVNAMALCRGDVKPDSCRSCIKNSSLQLTKSCPNQKEAVVWYDDCMLRYSNRSIFGNMEFGPYFWMYNLNNVSEVSQFREVLGSLLNNLTKEAASGSPLRKFATGNSTASSSQTIYALMQCTPDLSEKECVDCLNNATSLIPKCCDQRQGGRVVAPSCNFRYEKDIFYDSTVNAATPSPSPSPSPQSPSSSEESPSSSPQSPSSSPASRPAASEEDPQSPPPTQSPTNSATQRGRESNLPQTVVHIAIPLLILQYLSSTSAFF